jgi:hypothetical protein
MGFASLSPSFFTAEVAEGRGDAVTSAFLRVLRGKSSGSMGFAGLSPSYGAYRL